MFESVTKRRKNPIINVFGWSLIAIVCVIFVFIGLSPNSSMLAAGGAAAEVNGDAISLREFKQLADRMGEQSKPGDRDGRQKAQQQALDLLVRRSLIVQEAKNLNIFVSDKEVAQALLDIQPFYEDGVFSRLRYKTYLQQTRMSESEFENKIREDLLVQKMSDIISFTAKDIGMVEQFDKKIDQAKINVSYLSISPELLSGGVTLTGSKLSEYIASNKEKVEKYFQNHKNDFRKKDRVKARHILVKAKDEKEESMAQALEKMKSVVAQTKVSNFSEMAKKYSDDPGSKEKGGDLGFFERGRMVPPFENAAFSGKVGEISEPVKTKYGYHIILVDEKEEAKEPELKNVEDKIANIIYRENIYDDVIAQVSSKIKEKDYEGVSALAQQNNLKWKDTGFFSITKETIPGIGKHKEFLDSALALSKESPYTDQLVRKGETSYFIKFKEAKLDDSEKANPQMDFFKQFMKQQKATMAIQSWTDSLKKKASIKLNQDLLR